MPLSSAVMVPVDPSVVVEPMTAVTPDTHKHTATVPEPRKLKSSSANPPEECPPHLPLAFRPVIAAAVLVPSVIRFKEEDINVFTCATPTPTRAFCPRGPSIKDPGHLRWVCTGEGEACVNSCDFIVLHTETPPVMTPERAEVPTSPGVMSPSSTSGGEIPQVEGNEAPPNNELLQPGQTRTRTRAVMTAPLPVGKPPVMTPAPQEVPPQTGGDVTVIPTGSQEPSDRGRGAPPAQQAPSTKAHAREDEGDDDSATSSKDAAVDDAGAS